MKLFNEFTKIKKEEKSMKIKKKKGFTLIELIAVIAILAILAAIIVPRVTGYTARATLAKNQANAKTIVMAVQAYNADATAVIDDGTALSAITAGTGLDTTGNAVTALTNLKAAIADAEGASGTTITSAKTITELKTMSN